MARRTQQAIGDAKKLSRKALESIRKDNQHPGFDYAATLLELVTAKGSFPGYDYDEIAEFCRYKSKGSIAKLVSEKRIPSHPQGEMLYILYVETFSKKPPTKTFKESKA